MSESGRGQHSAAEPALGYLYQIRYALLNSLRRLRNGQEFIVNMETLDDVVFEKDGDAPELLQTKHHLKKAANLTDSSPDLWKTLRIWAEAIRGDGIPDGTLYFLITTAKVADGHAAHYLTHRETRNPETARERLNSTASTSTNKGNAQAYEAYRSLSQDQVMNLLENVYVIDGAPNISDLSTELKEVAFGFAAKGFIESFLQRLEGWWYRRAIQNLVDVDAKPILSEELESETATLREQFKQESLPIDEDIMRASVEASGYLERYFVHQLKLIEIGNPRIIYAIKNFYRAFTQRSRWVREDLLLVGELEHYEDRLIEEWDIQFLRMQDELGGKATNEAKLAAGQAIYQWIETATHPQVRSGVTEPSISRGTYQLLSESQRVGWHLEFEERLRHLLEDRKAAS